MWDHLLEILALLLQFPVLGWYLLLSSNAVVFKHLSQCTNIKQKFLSPSQHFNYVISIYIYYTVYQFNLALPFNGMGALVFGSAKASLVA